MRQHRVISAGGRGGLGHNPYQTNKYNTLYEFYLSYAKDLKAIKSHLDVIGGYSYNDYQAKIYYYATYNAVGVKYPNTDPAFPYDKPEHNLISYFGRANYSFDNKYLLTATIRRDGSSRFSPNNRWGIFPSAAFAWKIKDETFLRNSNVVSDLKLRAGYGITGQQDGIGNYDYLAYYYLSNANASYQFGNNYYQGYRPGGFLCQPEMGTDSYLQYRWIYGFLNNRITGSVDFYLKKNN